MNGRRRTSAVESKPIKPLYEARYCETFWVVTGLGGLIVTDTHDGFTFRDRGGIKSLLSIFLSREMA